MAITNKKQNEDASPLYIYYYTGSDQIEANIKTLYFDIVTSINHKFESEISQFPLEDGSIISDHIINKPDKLTFTVEMSNSPFQNVKTSNDGTSVPSPINYPGVVPQQFNPIPLRYPPSGGVRTSDLNIAGGLNAAASAVGLGNDITPQPAQYGRSGGQQLNSQPASNFVVDKDRVQQMFQDLDLLRMQKKVINVVTKKRNYFDMAITSIDAPENTASGNSLAFTITCEKVKRVKLGISEIAVPAELIAARKRAQGSKSAKANTKETAQNAQTQSQTGSEDPRVQAKKAELARELEDFRS